MEFKKLSDVEVVAEPIESANVLIEENGVIKKAPKTAVGGGGEYDAVIHLEDGYSIDTVASFTLVEGSYENVRSKIDAKEMPNILIYWHYNYGDFFDVCVKAQAVMAPVADVDVVSIDFIFNYYTNTTPMISRFYLASDGYVGLWQ